MQLELGFLDHLMGMLAIDGVNGYDPRGSSTAITRARPHGGLHVLDLQRLAMSIPTLQGLQTALSGLLAEQQALDVTGHNIANANTEGYSRQSADVHGVQPGDPDPRPLRVTGQGAQLGTGVTVETIHAASANAYLDAQYRSPEHQPSSAADPDRRARTGAERFQRALEQRHLQPAVELLERLEQPRRGAHERSRQGRPWSPPASGSPSAFNQLSAQLGHDLRAGR